MTVRRTDGSSGRFRRKVLAVVGTGCLAGAGILVFTPRAANATGATDCPIFAAEGDCYTGSSFSFNAAPNVATGVITVGQVTDSNDTPADLTAVIQWGDGVSDAGTVNGSTGDITGGPHTYASPGAYLVTIDVTDFDEGTTTLPDNGTGTTELSGGTAFVPDISGTSSSFSATEGVPTGSTVVATFSDFDDSCSSAGASDFTAMINWGDGVSSPGVVDCGAQTVSGSHTYTADEGTTYPVTVDMTDSDEATQTLPSGNSGNAELSGGTVTINDAAITPAATPRNAVEGAGFTSSLGVITDAAGAAADPADYSVALTCYNDLGPGGSPTLPANEPNDCLPASLTPVQNHPGQFTVNGSGVFLEEGVFDVQTFITDGESPGPVQEMSTMDSYVTVGDAPLTVSPVSTIQAKKGQSFKKIVANFKDADPHGTTSDYTANVDWGDGSISAGTVAPNGMGGWSVTGTHKYTHSGGFSVTTTVNDLGGATKSTVTQVRAK